MSKANSQAEVQDFNTEALLEDFPPMTRSVDGYQEKYSEKVQILHWIRENEPEEWAMYKTKFILEALKGT